MEVKNLKDFKALVKACRSLGVDACEVGALKFNLGKVPIKHRAPTIESVDPLAHAQVPKFTGDLSDPETVPTDGLTDEQLLNWSSQDHLPTERQ